MLFLLLEGQGVRLLRASTALQTYTDLTEGFIGLFLSVLRQSIRRGLLQGYRVIEESGYTVRGRLRAEDQLRRRFGLPLPVEVTFDEYTEDIEENRLIKAALRRLEVTRPEAPILRSRIAESLGSFGTVADRTYDRHRLPVFRYTRLSEPYRPLLELSALIVRSMAVELRVGDRPISGLLFDMNKIFEDFVFESLRRRLAPRFAAADTWRQGFPISLDQGGLLRPEPDFSWWRGSRCAFVGDAKYKNTVEGQLSDIYQLLAYCTATGLREGLLVYAQQASGPSVHTVRHDGPTLRVEAIDLEAPVNRVSERCDELANRILYMASPAASLAQVS